MKIVILGTGYVGLVTGVCLAHLGHQVTNVDIDAAKIKQLNEGRPTIFEPGLDDLLTETLKAKRIRFTTDPTVITDAEVVFIAVGTPSQSNGEADLSYVFQAATTIARHLSSDHATLMVGKSTVPVGTGAKVQQLVKEELAKLGHAARFCYASNPEFLKQGDAVADFLNAERIVVGADDPEAAAIICKVYKPLASKIIKMNLASAELTKYAANAFLATKISFINEIALLASKVGANIDQVRDGIGSDARINPYFLRAGCGYGGSCFPKDVRALAWMFQHNGVDSMFLDTVEAINNRQKHWILAQLKELLGSLEGKTIALWGLAFKPNTNDMREAPSRVLMEHLWHEGAKVQATDPEAVQEARSIYGERDDFKLVATKEEAAKGADALVLVTEWQEYRDFDAAKLKTLLKQPIIVDGRNFYDPNKLRALGFTYRSVGRP